MQAEDYFKVEKGYGMSTIIDEIAKAETQADEIRVLAAAKAREAVAAAKDEAQQALSQQESKERETTRRMLDEAEKDGTALAGKLTADMEAEADNLCKQAEQKSDQAIEYLLNKVRGLA